MAEALITGNLHVTGNITAVGTNTPGDGSITNVKVSSAAAIARSKLAQDTLQKYPIALTDFRVFDAFQTLLPGAGAADDLGLVGGTFATNSPSLQTQDLKAAGATNNRARVLIRLPMEYDDAQTVQIRLHCGMKTTVADVTATIDVECRESDKEEGISAELCTTAATTMNSVTMADVDFTITATSLVSGDLLDIRITTAINDGGTGTAVIGIIGSVELLCDVKG